MNFSSFAVGAAQPLKKNVEKENLMKYSVVMQMFRCLDELKSFREEGIFNYSTMLMRDDLGVLLLGAREAIYALDINNISVRKAVVRTPSKTPVCRNVQICW